MKSPSLLMYRTLLLLACCLSLSSCKENQALQMQLNEAHEKVKAIQVESQEIDKKLADYRKEIPAYAGIGVAGANQYAVQLATELVNTESLVAQARTSLKEAEAALETARKNLQTVKSKDPR